MGESLGLLAPELAASPSADDEDMFKDVEGERAAGAVSLGTDNMDEERQERVATILDNHVGQNYRCAQKRLHWLIPITFPPSRTF